MIKERCRIEYKKEFLFCIAFWYTVVKNIFFQGILRECVLGRLNFSIFAIKCVDWLESMDFKEEISIKKRKIVKNLPFFNHFYEKKVEKKGFCSNSFQRYEKFPSNP